MGKTESMLLLPKNCLLLTILNHKSHLAQQFTRKNWAAYLS